MTKHPNDGPSFTGLIFFPEKPGYSIFGGNTESTRFADFYFQICDGIMAMDQFEFEDFIDEHEGLKYVLECLELTPVQCGGFTGTNQLRALTVSAFYIYFFHSDRHKNN